MRPLRVAAAAALALSAPASAHDHSSSAPTGTVGEVAFANSGAPAAQAAFLRGLALLHNFEYPAAAAAFQEAQKTDPGFVMAYWGEAMTHNHPVWMAQDLEAARAALAKLGPTGEARRAKAKSPRELAYLDAVETLYGEGSKEERDFAYSAKMAALHAAQPADVDARAFYALSLLGLAHQGRDVSLYMRAAALLEEVFPRNQRHPGVLHYLIHSYDDPVHAPLGVRAARLYGQVAPEAGHALHMTSHIFLALGQWPEVERVNVEAMRAVNRPREAAGRPTLHCGHYPEWLIYAQLQQGRNAEADAGIEACRGQAGQELASAAAATRIEPGRSALRSLADLEVRRLIETGRWERAPGLALPDGRYLATRFTLAYGDLIAAAGDSAKVSAARAAIEAAGRAIVEARASEGIDYVDAPRREKVVLLQAAGLARLAEGDAEGGLAQLRAAAAAEAAMPAGFGPPLVEKPSWELLGDALLRLGRKVEAAKAYEAALAAAPNRRLSIAGLAASRR